MKELIEEHGLVEEEGVQRFARKVAASPSLD
jgi:hypothetical protein